jgi:hypothetical protein
MDSLRRYFAKTEPALCALTDALNTPISNEKTKLILSSSPGGRLYLESCGDRYLDAVNIGINSARGTYLSVLGTLALVRPIPEPGSKN